MSPIIILDSIFDIALFEVFSIHCSLIVNRCSVVGFQSSKAKDSILKYFFKTPAVYNISGFTIFGHGSVAAGCIEPVGFGLPASGE